MALSDHNVLPVLLCFSFTNAFFQVSDTGKYQNYSITNNHNRVHVNVVYVTEDVWRAEVNRMTIQPWHNRLSTQQSQAQHDQTSSRKWNTQQAMPLPAVDQHYGEAMNRLQNTLKSQVCPLAQLMLYRTLADTLYLYGCFAVKAVHQFLKTNCKTFGWRCSLVRFSEYLKVKIKAYTEPRENL